VIRGRRRRIAFTGVGHYDSRRPRPGDRRGAVDEQEQRRMTSPLRLAVAAALGLGVAVPALAEATPSGAYLAARQASTSYDYVNAVRYYTEALAQDPSNVSLMEDALISYVGMGDLARGLPLARRLAGIGADSQLAELMLLSERLKKGEFDAVVAGFERGETFSPLIDGLLWGWALLGGGRAAEAGAQFDRLSASPALKSFGQYHKALALAAAGDFEGAHQIIAEANKGQGVSRGALIAEVEILSQLERRDEAIARLDGVLKGNTDPELEQMRDRLAAGETLPYTYLTTAEQGAAEVFFALASALRTETPESYTVLYARLAQYLRPDSVDILLLVAELLEAQGRYDLAIRAYSEVPKADPAFHTAEIGRAKALFESGDEAGSVEVLQALARSHDQIAAVHVTLGDTLRRLERYDEAAEAYDHALALLGAPQPSHWFVYYVRGISHERRGDWAKSEADLRQALALNPEQPLVLNYLGYSLVERGEKLDEALKMIEAAVAARPEDGYITDSLGWVLYRLGRFDEAVAPMERAVELRPVDPILNDHLGDVYWMVDRKLEAQFQWRRALSFDPEEKDAARIRDKLARGLDLVLEDEAKTAVTQNGK
jgi:tetratricopeptide (TPR) repeat protein